MCAIESNKTQNLFRASSFENFVLGIELKFKSQSKLLIFSSHCLEVIFIFHANNAKGIKTKLNHHIDNHKHLLVLYVRIELFRVRDRVFYWLLAGCTRNCTFRDIYQRSSLILGPFYNYVFPNNNYGIDKIQVLDSLASFFIKREEKTYLY